APGGRPRGHYRAAGGDRAAEGARRGPGQPLEEDAKSPYEELTVRALQRSRAIKRSEASELSTHFLASVRARRVLVICLAAPALAASVAACGSSSSSNSSASATGTPFQARVKL